MNVGTTTTTHYCSADPCVVRVRRTQIRTPTTYDRAICTAAAAQVVRYFVVVASLLSLRVVTLSLPSLIATSLALSVAKEIFPIYSKGYVQRNC